MLVLDWLRDYRIWKWLMKFYGIKDEIYKYFIGFFGNNKEFFDFNLGFFY